MLHSASSGSFLITPNVGLMIWTLLLFGISLYVLAKVAFPRITEALDKRQHAIEDSIEHAERIRHEADDLLADYRERLQAARRQADEIIDRARKAGEVHERESEAEARQRREERMERARRAGPIRGCAPGEPRFGRVLLLAPLLQRGEEGGAAPCHRGC